ncbi:hypothetical protein [Loktanella salsilacus]|jgi:hypothetical protein|uniref:Uncharacterized protein n=1 Tax=Loktanella salsilacus TaxID=195913 RepID=A0A1I4EQM1_9RHOB|nr:hypothetical protein [Loktanella salsilacus]UTH45203.1 hypothetical protein KBK07_03735 [Loktanella salsilacus]UTH49013.1 hypothetical protein KBW81_04235 [Loktanella salsilacus]SFL08042.1 hypothetical protein SAMN04488004_107122 [Loktanella salsilacus]
MGADLPDYYFRIRENGAAVFRVDTENRQRRIEMDQIAVVNVRNGEVKPQGDRSLTDADIEAIQEWLNNRVALLAQRDIDDIHRAVDYLNITTQWVQAKASDDQLEDVTDALLLAMHDLRTVLIRKKADRMLAEDEKKSGDD